MTNYEFGRSSTEKHTKKNETVTSGDRLVVVNTISCNRTTTHNTNAKRNKICNEFKTVDQQSN